MATRTHNTPSRRAALRLYDIGRMPLVTARELCVMRGSGSEVATRNSINRLLEFELVDCILHCADDETRASRRFFLTARGVRFLSQRFGLSIDELNERLMYSNEWLTILRRRIDEVALAYKVACLVAQVSPSFVPMELIFRRKGYPDSIIAGNNGITVGIMRWGPTLSYSTFVDRMYALNLRRKFPSLLLMVAPDMFGKLRLDSLLRTTRYASVFADVAAVASEREVNGLTATEGVWWRAFVKDESLSLERLVDAASPARYRPESRIAYSKSAFPRRPEMPELSVTLRRTLNSVFAWPLMTTAQLAALHGISEPDEARYLERLRDMQLVDSIPLLEHRLSHIAAYEGLRLLAYRDRTSVGPFLNRWDLRRSGGREPSQRTPIERLHRERDHTHGVNHFVSRLASEWRGSMESTSGETLRRNFRFHGRRSQVSPDMAAILYRGNETHTVLLEYELRADSSDDMTQKLSPWIRYYGAKAYWRDFPSEPLLLFVLGSAALQRDFLSIARELSRREKVVLPLAVGNAESLNRKGARVMEEVWMTLSNDERGLVNPFP